jgi:hypothetical protein
MKLSNKQGIMVLLLWGCCLQGMTALAAGQSASDYYTEPPLYGMRPGPNAETEMGPIGATGIDARIYKGVRVTVENIEPNTPASGKFSKGDVILGVNGAKLAGKNPLVVLGSALTEAEAADGVLTFDVKPAKDGEPKQVAVTIPVLGAYSKTFPLKCEKSAKIIKRAAEFYSGPERLQGHGFGVRKVHSDGRNRAVIIHTATGRHREELHALFADVISSDHAG